jgi:hypothetical protein
MIYTYTIFIEQPEMEKHSEDFLSDVDGKIT